MHHGRTGDFHDHANAALSNPILLWRGRKREGLADASCTTVGSQKARGELSASVRVQTQNKKVRAEALPELETSCADLVDQHSVTSPLLRKGRTVVVPLTELLRGGDCHECATTCLLLVLITTEPTLCAAPPDQLRLLRRPPSSSAATSATSSPTATAASASASTAATRHLHPRHHSHHHPHPLHCRHRHLRQATSSALAPLGHCPVRRLPLRADAAPTDSRPTRSAAAAEATEGKRGEGEHPSKTGVRGSPREAPTSDYALLCR
ncbi:unnamed protein product [Closterium sp. NIES-65]|nr:unnamed protein product [Closterium sp. NIES-65]